MTVTLLRPVNEIRKILFIGSDRADLYSINHCLAQGGLPAMHADWAATLASALVKLRDEPYEAILLDLFFPDSEGLPTLEAIRNAAPSVPIMVVARPQDEPATPALRWGVQDYLVKGDLEARPLARAIESLIARKLAEEDLFAEKDRAEVTLHSIGDGVLSTDLSANVIYLNPVAERMTGWTREEAFGKPAADVFRIVDASTRKPVRDPLQLAIRHDKSIGVTANRLLVRRDGFETAIEDTVAPVHDRNGRASGAVVVFHDVSEARAVALKLSHLAQHDFLTDLPNRVLFDDRLTQAIAMARRHQRQLAVLFLDCDNFKEINDTLGHAIGDLLLQSVAKRLVAAGRGSDTVSRQGGDEFVILLTEVEGPEDAGLVAKKILKALATPHRVGRHDLHVTASIGIAVYPSDGRNAGTLIRCADTALYDAKEGGRNTYRYFRPHMKVRAVERRSAEGSLLRALEKNEFRLHYQPQVDLATGGIVGVEALVRWNHPQRGLIPPAEFVPTAEESGLIVPIGRWVLREACRQLADWRVAGLEHGPVAVNVSAVELRSTRYLAGVAESLSEFRLDGSLLELEITESALMQDVDIATESLNALRGLGVRVTLDDFGTGYSSLSHLQRFPIGTLKIDRSFVHDVSSEANVRTIVATIIAMGKSLGKTVIAEGIETEAQLDVLRGLRCDGGQGYHFCRPLPADDLTTYLGAATAGSEAGSLRHQREARI